MKKKYGVFVQISSITIESHLKQKKTKYYICATQNIQYARKNLLIDMRYYKGPGNVHHKK